MLKRRNINYSIFICILLISVLLTACNFSKKAITEDVGDAKWDIGNNVGEKWKDGQNQFIKGGSMAESERGYYFTKGDNSGRFNVLYFFDKVTGKSTVVCDQANCKHNEEKCPAYLPPTITGYCYYNGYLYYLAKDDSQSTNLYQMDYDGHNKKEIMTLCNINEAYLANTLRMHRDTLFYVVVGQNNENIKLYKINMAKDEKEILIDVSGNVRMNDLKCLENKIYYDLTYKLNDGTMTTAIYQYSIDTGDTQKLIDGEYCNSYTVTADFIFYATNHNVNKYDIKSGKTTVLMDDVKWGQLSNDGTYLYLDVDKNSNGEVIPRNIFVYDWNDHIINTIPVDQSVSKLVCLFGDTDYLFFEEPKKQELYYIDKTKLATKEYELIKSEVIK